MKRSREPQEDLDPGSLEADADRLAGSDGAPRPPSKISGVDTDGDRDDWLAMTCSLPPHQHPISFRSYTDYEAHYHKFHTNRCLECRKNFPSDQLLGVHIEECHDPLVKIKRDRGEHTVSLSALGSSHLPTSTVSSNKMQYSCFVQGCPRKCLTPQKRRMHMIDKHTYPKNFFFAVTKEGIDGRRSLLVESGHHPRRSSTVAQSNDSRYWASTPKASQAGETPGPSLSDTGNSEPKPDQQGAVDSDMADLTGAMSALRFVPSSVRFGRGRAGFARR